jgi:hypothetical protein
MLLTMGDPPLRFTSEEQAGFPTGPAAISSPGMTSLYLFTCPKRLVKKFFPLAPEKNKKIDGTSSRDNEPWSPVDDQYLYFPIFY